MVVISWGTILLTNGYNFVPYKPDGRKLSAQPGDGSQIAVDPIEAIKAALLRTRSLYPLRRVNVMKHLFGISNSVRSRLAGEIGEETAFRFPRGIK